MIHLPGVSIDTYLAGAGANTRASVRTTTTGPILIYTDLVIGGTIDGVTLQLGDRVLVREQGLSKEITTVTTVADVGGSLGGKYFTINSRTNDYYVWINVGGSTDPAPSGKTGVVVAISANATAATVAGLLQTAINLIGDFTTSLATTTVTITDLLNGPSEDAADFNTGFTITTTQQGTSSVDNVIWEVTSGAPVKPADMDVGDGIASVSVNVVEGTVWEDSSWYVINDPPNDIVGSDEITWVQSASGSKIVANAIRTDSGIIETIGGGTPSTGKNFYYDGTQMAWQESIQNIMTTQGDILIRGAAVPERLPIGTDGQILSTNGTTMSWGRAARRVNLGFNHITISTSYTVAVDDYYYIEFTASAGNNVVVLPDATTLPDGWETYLINTDTSTASIDFKDNANNHLITIKPGNDIRFTLIHNITTAGRWGINNKKPSNRIIVAKSGGDFTSIKSAIDSITDATSTNPYVVDVYPGIYTEDAITMKQYVVVHGADHNSCVIEPSLVSQTMITMASNSSLSTIMIRGATGGIGILIDSVTGAMLMDNIIMNCSTCIKGTATTADMAVELHSNTTTGTHAIGTHYDARAVTGAFNIVVLCFGCNHIGSPTGTITTLLEGPNLLCTYTGAVMRGSGNGTSFKIADGAEFLVSDTKINNYVTAIEIPNVGAAPLFEGMLIRVRGCTNDFTQSHPTTTGVINGVLDFTKITNASNSMSINIQDRFNSKTVITGDITLGRTLDQTTNFLDAFESGNLGVITGGVLAVGTSALKVKPTKGIGYIEITDYDVNLENQEMQRIGWDGTDEITLSANTTNYIYFDNTTTLSASMSSPNIDQNIILGIVRTNATAIEWIDQSRFNMHHINVVLEEYSRNIFGSIYVSGSLVTANASRQLEVSSGSRYYGLNHFAPSGVTSPLSFTQYNHVASAWTTSTQTIVNNTQYDNGTNLTSLTTSYYTKHAMYTIGDGTDEKYYLIVGDAEFSTLLAAQDATLPMTPNWFGGSIVAIASLIVQQGVTTVVEIIDERPVLGSSGSGGAAISDHGLLTGLLDDDHPQYLLVNGTRAMTANLNMGGFSITNVNLVDGITMDAHGSRHLPNGADPLTTAAPIADITSTTINSTGTANSYARSDHSHAIDSTIVTTTGAQTLTNKTITSTTNTISADLLRYTGGNVSIAASAAPATNNALYATSGTTATWQPSFYNILTTKGDIMSRTTSGPVRVGVGVDGNIPIADSSISNGWRWGLPTEADSGVVSTVIWDQKTTGTNGGTFTGGVWQTRNLNKLTDTEGGTELVPSTGGITLSANQMTVGIGSYFVISTATAYRVDGHQCRLRNITNGTTLLVGSSQLAKNSAQGSAGSSQIFGTISIASPKVIELQHYCLNTQTDFGYGVAAGIPTTPEIYSFLIFHKIRVTI